jgi:hypothetical protein
MREDVARSYGQLPNQRRPPLTGLFEASDEFLGTLSILAVVLVSMMGITTIALVRPRDGPGDVAAGLGVGVVSGLVVMGTGGLGMTVGMAMDRVLKAPVNRIPFESGALSRQVWIDSVRFPADYHVRGFPDLQGRPPAQQQEILYRKLIVDLKVAIFINLWAGFAQLGGMCLLMGTVSTAVAGNLWRRHGSLRRTLMATWSGCCRWALSAWFLRGRLATWCAAESPCRPW